MPTEPDLPSIIPSELDDVTGGANASDSSSQVSAALQGILGSIKDLGSQNTSSGNSLSQLLPLMLMLRGGGGGGGACPCGCGMANCMRR